MNGNRLITATICFLVVATLGFSQSDPATAAASAARRQDNHEAAVAVELSALTEALSLPSLMLVQGPIHPGSLFGVEVPVKRTDDLELFVEFNGGFFLHDGFQNGVFVGAEFGLTYLASCGLGLSTSAGLGYLHTFYPGPLYELTENGSYEQVRDWGCPHLTVSVPLELSYHLEHVSSWPIAIFAQYRIFAEIPGIPGWEMYILPHTAFLIGLKYFL